MQFSRQAIYNGKFDVKANEVFVNDSEQSFDDETIDLFTQFLEIIRGEVDKKLDNFHLIIPALFFPYVKLMDNKITKNLFIKVDVASRDQASIDQMLEINKGGFGLAVDIKDRQVIDKLPDNTKYVMINAGVIHLLKEDLANLNSDYICVAKSVDEYNKVDELKKIGVHFYSGNFLETPEKIESGNIAPSKTAILSLMASLSDPDVELDEVTKLVEYNSMLSFNILKIINSPIYRTANEMKSIQEAIVRFGFQNLKKWVMMLSLFSLGDKTKSLIKISLQRAVMCSKLSVHLKFDDSDSCYTAGLFSMLDAFLDHPIKQLLKEVSINQSIVDGILEGSGTIGKILGIVKKYQHGDVSFSDSALTNIFMESAQETNEIMKAVGM